MRDNVRNHSVVVVKDHSMYVGRKSFKILPQCTLLYVDLRYSKVKQKVEEEQFQ